MDPIVEQFNKERNEAFLSLDEQKIRAHQLKWNKSTLTSNPFVFWGAVHKAITGIKSLPIEFRLKSKAWLNEHKLQSLDDGEL